MQQLVSCSLPVPHGFWGSNSSHEGLAASAFTYGAIHVVLNLDCFWRHILLVLFPWLFLIPSFLAWLGLLRRYQRVGGVFKGEKGYSCCSPGQLTIVKWMNPIICLFRISPSGPNQQFHALNMHTQQSRDFRILGSVDSSLLHTQVSTGFVSSLLSFYSEPLYCSILLPL